MKSSKTDSRIMAIDIGNSRIKIKQGTQVRIIACNDGWEGRMISLFKAQKNRQLLIGISSVSPEKKRSVISFAKYSKAEQIFDIKKLFQTQKLIQFEARNMGTDRMLGLYGALLHTSPPLITVDCGTAITVNMLTASRVCPGGCILPGLQTQLHALHKATALLPLIRPAFPGPATGRSTREAMLSGVVRGAAGAIQELIQGLNSEAGISSAHVLVTGGDGAIICRLLEQGKQSVQYHQHLVCEGIENILKQFIQNSK